MLTTFVVVNGGPPRVEMAGSIADVARSTLPDDFRLANETVARAYGVFPART